MKSRALSIAVGAVIVIVLLMYLFSYQVRETETAVLLTFGKANPTTPGPGLHFRWPYPVQRVEKFERRLILTETPLDEMLTSDRQNIVVTLAVGWYVDDPLLFRSRSGGSLAQAENYIKQLVNHQSSVIGQYKLANFVSTEKDVMQFSQIEQALTEPVNKSAETLYGIKVPLVRIRSVALPESAQKAVYERMAAERAKEASRFRSEGQGLANEIVSRAISEQTQILARANADANRIRSEGDAEAAKYYSEFDKNPELAIFLREVKALRKVLAERGTMVVDLRTPPFNLFAEHGVVIPAAVKPVKAAEAETPNKDAAKAPALPESEAKVGG